MRPDASDDWRPLAAEGSAPFEPAPCLGGGFEHSFALPFARCHVWEALNAEPPLGTPPELRYQILRGGRRGKGGGLALGSVRRAEFQPPLSGSTVSQLVQLERGASDDRDTPWVITWRQLLSHTSLDLRGKGEHLPELSVRLKGGEEGTLVTLVYNFATVQMSGCLGGCLQSFGSPLLRSSLAGCAAAWRADMEARSFPRTTHPTFGDSLLSNRSEEEASVCARTTAPSLPCTRGSRFAAVRLPCPLQSRRGPRTARGPDKIKSMAWSVAVNSQR